jgi:hypothetical protein
MVYFTHKATFRHTTRSILFDNTTLFQTRKKKITTQQTYIRNNRNSKSYRPNLFNMNLSLLGYKILNFPADVVLNRHYTIIMIKY